MKPRTFVLAASIVCCLFAASYAANNPFLGTWKLNEAKSTIPAGASKNTTVTYTVAGESIQVTTDGVDGSGKAVHAEWTGKFDGKPYPVTGMGSGETRSVKAEGERKLGIENFKDGKSTAKGSTEVAKDGKTRTLEIEATGPDGKKHKAKYIYDKQ